MSLTELEGAILGIVASRQPCSAYAVRRRFEKSTTWGWSSSKGAIYPAVRRLVDRKLLRATPFDQGKQNSARLQLSAHGEEALASWVATFPAGMGGAPVDPLRTRVSYLGVLSAADRETFLDQAERDVRAALDAVRNRETDPQARDRWALQASQLGVLMQIEAKLAWLQAVRKLIEPAAGSAQDAPTGRDSAK